MILKRFNIVRIILFLFPAFVFSQERCWVYFTDKKESVSIYKPNDFLTQESIDRRHSQEIEIIENDFPVSPTYIREIENLGFHVYRESRWLNAVSIFFTGTEEISLLKDLDFVAKIEFVNSYSRIDIQQKDSFINHRFISNPYGPSYGQIKQLNGHLVHEQGYRGNGVLIAVMDASFYMVDELVIFDSLWVHNRIIDSWDFVLNQEMDYDIDTIGSHGTMVLSCMGGYMLDSLIGTAPESSYMLYRTEDTSSETITEEDNWVAAMERADISGAHVINTSLGYSNLWDDIENTHTYEDMDGNSTVITIAADIAASKGILVVNSAGNSAENEWYYITAPADGDSVLSVGAISADSVIASFSSRGPTADGRMKPNIVAQGINTVVCNLDNGIRTANGTSFSSPILAGMAASLWSAMPNLSNMQLFNLIQESAHLFPNGNNDYGYGIPNFFDVLQDLGINEHNDNILHVHPNPFVDYFIVNLSVLNTGSEVELSIFNSIGQQVYFKKELATDYLRINLNNEFASGVYLLVVKHANELFHLKVVR